MVNIENINETADIRKLATTATVLEVFPIEGADAIEGIKIRGWNVVVKKGEYKVGDKTLYVEVDSVMPDGLAEELQLEYKALNKQLSKANSDLEKEAIKEKMAAVLSMNTRPEFEFLRQVKFRIKTRKILGQISQGICFPLSILDLVGVDSSTATEDDMDFTDVLGITQYVEPEDANFNADAKGDLTKLGIFISDEERVENLAKVYPKLRGFKYVASEKLEGSSAAYVLKNEEFNVCSRKLNLNENEDNTFWRVAHRLDIEEKMREFGPKHGLVNWSLQGELVGEGVQGNIYKLQGHTVEFYNAFNIDTQEYLEYSDFMELIKEMGLSTCPIIDDDYTLPETIDELFALVDNYTTKYGNNPKQLAEGWVFVAKGNVVGTRIERADYGRLSFKAKSRNYDIGKKK